MWVKKYKEQQELFKNIPFLKFNIEEYTKVYLGF
jgi:hypothetical protein